MNNEDKLAQDHIEFFRGVITACLLGANIWLLVLWVVLG